MGAPADYPVMLAPGPLLTSRLPLRDLDVLHTMHPFLAGRLALKWSRLSGAPVVFTAHTQYERVPALHPHARRVGRAMLRPHVAAFARRVNAVLAPGRAMVRRCCGNTASGAMSSCFPTRWISLRSGPAEGLAFRAQYHVPQDAPLAMYLGRLAPEKNLDVMLRAFEQARASRPELRLLVVGDGSSREGGRPQRPRRRDFHRAGALCPRAGGSGRRRRLHDRQHLRSVAHEHDRGAGRRDAPLVAARSPAALDLIVEGVNGTVREPTADALAAGLLEVLYPANLPGLQAGARHSAQQYDLRARAEALEQVYLRAIAKKRR